MLLETARLRAREFTPDDLDTIIALRADDDVARYIGGARSQTREFNVARLQFYLDCYAKLGFGMCALVWKETNEIIGWGGLQPLADTSDTEVGYGMKKAFWGKGIGFEIAKACLAYGFRELNLQSIVAVAVPENANSRRIMEKCGMKYEKTEAHYGVECVFYRVARRAFLEKFTE